jgi:hypothetical protein
MHRYSSTGGQVNGRSRLLFLVCVLSCLGLCLFSACAASGGSQSLSLVGRPSVTAAFIDQVLAAHHSPAQGLGSVFYDLGEEAGIDPAFALAFFRVESSYGLAGVAVQSLSIGNLRCLPDYPCRDGFAWFPSWAEGIKAWYRLIAGPLYVGAGLSTLPAVVHRYAPASDNNDEVAYVQAVATAITSWRSGRDV